MPDYGATERVRQFVTQQIVKPARSSKSKTLRIHCGTLEKSLVQRGVLQRNRFPIVCNALRSRKFCKENHMELIDIQAPPSGQSSTVVYTYQLLPEGPQTTPPESTSLLQFRGVLHSVYKQLGGAEAFHQKQRKVMER